MEKLDPFFDYYQRELTYLRRSGSHFAQQYPKIAKRLDVGPSDSSDPHVERLLESFAYLTARLQRDIDDQFPRFTEALLGVLYPQFVNPVPPFAIARFETSPHKGKLTSAVTIPKGTKLFSRAETSEVCHFQTGWAFDFVPASLTHADVLSTNTLEGARQFLNSSRSLQLKLASNSGTFQDMNLKTLRVHIAGNKLMKNTLYEAIFSQNMQVVLVPRDGPQKGNPVVLGPDALKQVGFEEEEAVLPYPAQSHPGYRLLMEYFYYPEKFFFFDIESKKLGIDAKEIDIYLSLSDQVTINPTDVSHSNFLLGCVPVINLFHKITEPIRLDHRSVEYRLIADQRLEKHTEIHSILSVSAAIDGSETVERFMPYFSYNHQMSERGHKSFWHARRLASKKPDIPGTDLHLSFVDFDFNPVKPVTHTLFARTLCTNRALARELSAGTTLFAEESIPASKLYILDRPTRQVYPPRDGQVQWRLISQLALNHLALTGGEEGLCALKEIIRLYANLDRERLIPELDALTKMETTRVTRRFGQDAWRGFSEGTQVSLTFDLEKYHDLGAFVFSSVLNHFFSLFTAVNTFTELEIYNANYKDVWKRWDPQSGNKVLL